MIQHLLMVDLMGYVRVYTGSALGGAGAQLGTISVGPGSQSTCTKVFKIGRGAQLGAIKVA